MYIPIEEEIKAVTKGVCPYRNKICDGLCNNCGIIPEVLYPKSNTSSNKITPSKGGYICTYDDLDILEDRVI